MSARATFALGCIADDFTGATDLGNTLANCGLRVLQTIGVPNEPLKTDAHAIVVALKSRTIAPSDAISQSLQALSWLQSQGAQQIYFKYCSTFDSTAQGNIGPVTEALMDALKTDFTVATPAFPDNQRTVFKGHLFVGDVLLSDSGMRNHPLTPMRDANLVRVMQAQCKRRVGLIDHRAIANGPAAVRARIAELRAQGVGIAIADALSNGDLLVLGAATRDLPLVTAASGLAHGLAKVHAQGHTAMSDARQLAPKSGYTAVVAGSCSEATQRQVAHFLALGLPSFCIDPVKLAAGDDVTEQALSALVPQLGPHPVLVYSTAAPASVQQTQAQLGLAASGELIEKTLAAIALGLTEQGVGQLIVAGGETSGAVVQALGVKALQIGPQVAPGVPWCHAVLPKRANAIHLVLKSGNFGADDIFTRAFEVLP